MDIINFIYNIISSPISWIAGMLFLFGYTKHTWTPKTETDEVIEEHPNDLQDLKLDNDALVISVTENGAIGNGSDANATANRIAMQAIIDYLKGTVGRIHENITKGRGIYWPEGNYKIDIPLKLYSGIEYFGDGITSTIEASAGFVGTELFKGVSIANARVTGARLRDLEFRASAGSGIAAFRIDSANNCQSINNKYSHLYFDTPYGLILDYYSQHDLIEYLYAYGAVDQILKLYGNNVRIFSVDKEAGAAGSNADPYIYIGGHITGKSTDIELEHILLEGTGDVNKAAIQIENAENIILNDFWCELSTTDGYCLKLKNIPTMKIKGWFAPNTTTEKVKVENVYNLYIDKLHARNIDMAWYDAFEIDATSRVFIDTLETMRGVSSFRHGLDAVIEKETLWQSSEDAPTGNIPFRYKPISGGHNLLQNGSFLAKDYKWAWSAVPDTTNEYIASEVSPGNMGHFKWSGIANSRFYQFIPIPAEWVGQTMTITALVKITKAARLSAWIGNTGITEKTTYPIAQSTATLDTGWQLLSMSHIHQNLHANAEIGFRFVSTDAAAELWIADAWYGFGYRCHTNPASFGSIDLGAPDALRTITYGAAAPATGTWKQGDIVFNTGAVAGGTPGWVCTTAGSPGTWKAMANLAA